MIAEHAHIFVSLNAFITIGNSEWTVDRAANIYSLSVYHETLDNFLLLKLKQWINFTPVVEKPIHWREVHFAPISDYFASCDFIQVNFALLIHKSQFCVAIENKTARSWSLVGKNAG